MLPSSHTGELHHVEWARLRFVCTGGGCSAHAQPWAKDGMHCQQTDDERKRKSERGGEEITQALSGGEGPAGYQKNGQGTPIPEPELILVPVVVWRAFRGRHLPCNRLPFRLWMQHPPVYTSNWVVSSMVRDVGKVPAKRLRLSALEETAKEAGARGRGAVLGFDGVGWRGFGLRVQRLAIERSIRIADAHALCR